MIDCSDESVFQSSYLTIVLEQKRLKLRPHLF